MARILLVLSGSDHWTLADGTRHPTGYWAEEFVVPHRTFRAQGVDVDIATPGGVHPTVDQASLSPEANGGDEAKAAGCAATSTRSRPNWPGRWPWRTCGGERATTTPSTSPAATGRWRTCPAARHSARSSSNCTTPDGWSRPCATALPGCCRPTGTTAAGYSRAGAHRVHQRGQGAGRAGQQGTVAAGDPVAGARRALRPRAGLAAPCGDRRQPRHRPESRVVAGGRRPHAGGLRAGQP